MDSSDCFTAVVLSYDKDITTEREVLISPATGMQAKETLRSQILQSSCRGP